MSSGKKVQRTPKRKRDQSTSSSTSTTKRPVEPPMDDDEEEIKTYSVSKITFREDKTVKDWDDFLKVVDNLKYIPDVKYFEHAPLKDVWDRLAVKGIWVELPNTFMPLSVSGVIHWIAKVIDHKGYKACVEYERFGLTPRHYQWISYCSSIPKPIGWCNNNMVLRWPDAEVRKRFPNFYDKEKESLGAACTIPSNHSQFVFEHNQASQAIFLPNGEVRPVKIGMILEVADKRDWTATKLARIQVLVGDRFHAIYLLDEDEDLAGYWFNLNSCYVHLPGWSQAVGLRLKDLPKTGRYPSLGDYRDEYFPPYPEDLIIEKGMWLECRHPYHLYMFVAVRVTKVLKHGYFIVEINSGVSYNESLYGFCFHVSSPLIFPCGWALENGLRFAPPSNCGIPINEYKRFSWVNYFGTRGGKPLLLNYIPAQHNFIVGHKLEAINLLRPTVLGPATILKIVGHMLLIHFDGFPMENKNCQWVESTSTDIYPIGWGEMVCHNFEGIPSFPVEKDLKDARNAGLIDDVQATPKNLNPPTN